MNKYEKLEKLKAAILDYRKKVESYGNVISRDISTAKVISELNKILKKCK